MKLAATFDKAFFFSLKLLQRPQIQAFGEKKHNFILPIKARIFYISLIFRKFILEERKLLCFLIISQQYLSEHARWATQNTHMILLQKDMDRKWSLCKLQVGINKSAYGKCKLQSSNMSGIFALYDCWNAFIVWNPF